MINVNWMGGSADLPTTEKTNKPLYNGLLGEGDEVAQRQNVQTTLFNPNNKTFERYGFGFYLKILPSMLFRLFKFFGSSAQIYNR